MFPPVHALLWGGGVDGVKPGNASRAQLEITAVLSCDGGALILTFESPGCEPVPSGLASGGGVEGTDSAV